MAVLLENEENLRIWDARAGAAIDNPAILNEVHQVADHLRQTDCRRKLVVETNLVLASRREINLYFDPGVLSYKSGWEGYLGWAALTWWVVGYDDDPQVRLNYTSMDSIRGWKYLENPDNRKEAISLIDGGYIDRVPGWAARPCSHLWEGFVPQRFNQSGWRRLKI